jgi:hypothetical protein
MMYGAYLRVSISGVYTKGVRKKRRFYWKTGSVGIVYGIRGKFRGRVLLIRRANRPIDE